MQALLEVRTPLGGNFPPGPGGAILGPEGARGLKLPLSGPKNAPSGLRRAPSGPGGNLPPPNWAHTIRSAPSPGRENGVLRRPIDSTPTRRQDVPTLKRLSSRCAYAQGSPRYPYMEDRYKDRETEKPRDLKQFGSFGKHQRTQRANRKQPRHIPRSSQTANHILWIVWLLCAGNCPPSRSSKHEQIIVACER